MLHDGRVCPRVPWKPRQAKNKRQSDAILTLNISLTIQYTGCKFVYIVDESNL